MLTLPVTFATFVESAFDEVSRYGASSVSVTCRLLEAIGSVSACVRRDGDREPLLEQATAIEQRSHSVRMSARDRAGIRERYEAALLALAAPEAQSPDRRVGG